MMPHDPHSYAASFNAMRHPFKTGSAFEGHQPRPVSVWWVVAGISAVAVVALAIVVAVQS